MPKKTKAYTRTNAEGALSIVNYTCVALNVPVCADLTEASQRLKAHKKLLRAHMQELTRLEKMIDVVSNHPDLEPPLIRMRMWTSDMLREQIFWHLVKNAPLSRGEIIECFTAIDSFWLLRVDVERAFDGMVRNGELIYSSQGWYPQIKNSPVKWPVEPEDGVIH